MADDVLNILAVKNDESLGTHRCLNDFERAVLDIIRLIISGQSLNIMGQSPMISGQSLNFLGQTVSEKLF